MKRRIPPDEDSKKFVEVFDSIDQSKRSGELWADFIYFCACTLSSQIDSLQYDSREKRFTDIERKYTQEQMSKFSGLLGITFLALANNPDRDFLGSIYSNLELTEKGLGQHFTPYHVGKLMAKMTQDSESDKQERYAACDPCCGAGGLLIAFANAAAEQGVNYRRDIFFQAQDVDEVTALTCYTQLSLLGCQGVILIGNSLSNEDIPPERTWHMVENNPVVLAFYAVLGVLDDVV